MLARIIRTLTMSALAFGHPATDIPNPSLAVLVSLSVRSRILRGHVSGDGVAYENSANAVPA